MSYNASNAPSSSSSQQRSPQEVTEVELATALMSISGPCRTIGDIYLACVATAGLGMCRHLRKDVVTCVEGTAEPSTAMLEGIAMQMCDPNSTEEEQMLCASRIVTKQLMSQVMMVPPNTDAVATPPS